MCLYSTVNTVGTKYVFIISYHREMDLPIKYIGHVSDYVKTMS
jgi:hypothetical protein